MDFQKNDEMKKYALSRALVKLNFITPRGIANWTSALCQEGTTLMALLRFSATTYPEQVALIAEGERISYSELYQRARTTAELLSHVHGVKAHNRVALLSRNCTEAVLAMFAVSRLGAHLYLLNSDMSPKQVEDFLGEKNYNLLILDEALSEKYLPSVGETRVISTREIREYREGGGKLPRVWRGGVLSVLSGGSSGRYTSSDRKPSTTAFLPPFFALIREIGIHQYDSIYIPLPFYHGFGLATLIVALVMGKCIWLTRHFNIEEALEGISKFGIQVLPVVPAMINRLLSDPAHASKLQSLRCILTGGDRLSRSQVELCETFLQQARLYNLYGTSEAGFFMLATPEQMQGEKEIPIGKPISGVACEIREKDENGVGALWVSSGWAMQSKKGKWQNTRDLAYKDASGRYFYRGRADRMVVCGGENVFLDHVERVLEQHPAVAIAKAYPLKDARFGQVIGADVELHKNGTISEIELLNWLKEELPRAAIPHKINFKQIQLLTTGKKK